LSSDNSVQAAFDFEAHRRAAINDYQKERPLYEAFTRVVESILKEALRASAIKVSSVESRTKALESFADKAAGRSEQDIGAPKYARPLEDITDMAAARVITFFLKDIDRVDQLIKSEFLVKERIDKSADLVKEDRLGYQSVHYVVQLRRSRAELSEYSRFAALKAEIQLRTVLQHAWAEIEHDIQYKSVDAIPSITLRRRFTSLAGLLEIADREFQAVQEADERLREQARRSVAQGKLGDVEITGDALKAYLDKTLGPDGRMPLDSYEWLADRLRRLGFRDLNEVEKAIKPYDHDDLSRRLWGARQGQHTRFEDMLLAALGQEFIDKDKFSKYQWFREGRGAVLQRMKKLGIPTQTYKREPSAKD